jgi:tRNA-Thr(GGU) m(6)t(6)A37 methyltransferase TsaA
MHIAQAYVPALQNLEHFSHVRILWWFHRLDGERLRRVTHNTPPYENAPVTGVFASRSPMRPNPIGLSTARVLSVDHETGIVAFAGTNVLDGTPLLDLKPYLPGGDRVRTFSVPEWMASWPAWATCEGTVPGEDVGSGWGSS